MDKPEPPIDRDGLDALGAIWGGWIRQTLGGTEDQIANATEAAATAISAGEQQDAVLNAARTAWQGGVGGLRPAEAVREPEAGDLAVSTPSEAAANPLIGSARDESPVDGDNLEALRAIWGGWIRQTLGGTEDQIASATEAAATAISAGAQQDAVLNAAGTAWQLSSTGVNSVGAAEAAEVSTNRSASTGAQPPVGIRDPSAATAPTRVVIPELKPDHQAQRASQASELDAPRPTGALRGRVAGYRSRAEQSFFFRRGYLYVWDFRLERPGLAPVQVEMRGFRMYGAIADGDDVEVLGRDSAATGLIHTRRLRNYTAQADVRVSYGRGRRLAASGAKLIIVLLILAAIALGIYYVARHHQGTAAIVPISSLSDQGQISRADIAGIVRNGSATLSDVAIQV